MFWGVQYRGWSFRGFWGLGMGIGGYEGLVFGFLKVGY